MLYIGKGLPNEIIEDCDTGFVVGREPLPPMVTDIVRLCLYTYHYQVWQAQAVLLAVLNTTKKSGRQFTRLCAK